MNQLIRMCPRLPNLRHSLEHQSHHLSHNSASPPDFNLLPNSSSLSSSGPIIVNSILNTGTATPNLTNQDHLTLDAFIDHLLTGGDLISNANFSQMNSTNQTGEKDSIFGYPMPVDLFSAIYAGAVTTGGLVGFLKAGSKPSLFAGLLFGSLLGYGTYLTSVNPNNYYLTLGTSSILASVMGFRFYKSGIKKISIII